MLLPYMEQSVVYNAINYSMLRGDPGNNTAMATSVNSFLCPSDPQTNLPPGQAGRGLSTQLGQRHPVRLRRQRPLGLQYQPAAVQRAFLPGQQDTARRHHRRHEQHGGVQRDGHGRHVQRHRHREDRLVLDPDLALDPRPGDLRLPVVPGLEPVLPGALDRGVPWIEGSTSAMYNHVNVPNKRTCIFPPGRILNTANSYHPGGVNLTLCDGSVRFVKDSISLPTWRALGSRMGARSSAQTRIDPSPRRIR